MNPEKLQPNETIEKEISSEIVKEVEESLIGAGPRNPEFGTTDKINLLLVAAGLKPASDIRFIIKEEDGMTGKEFKLNQSDIDKTLDLIRRTGLFFTTEKRTEEIKWKKGAKKKVTQNEELEILIGHTQEDLDALVTTWRGNDDKALGTALGFPETAVEAFEDRKKWADDNEIVKELSQEEIELMKFKLFRLSADNWREELSKIKPRADFIKRVSPKLYDKLMQSGI